MNIDVTYIADIERLIKDSFYSPNAYYDASTSGQDIVFGLTRWDNLNAGPYWPGTANSNRNLQGGVNLNIRAEANDKIRLRTESLSAGFKYQCFIQSITCYYANMTVTGHKCDAVAAALQATADAPTPSQSFDDYWELTVGDKTGTDQCTIHFSIFDSNATRIGGFSTYLYASWPGASTYSIS